MEALSCRLLPWEVADGPTNMAADEVLVRTAAERGIASLRYYGWSPATLSLGYFQSASARQDDPRLAALPFVRRPTGGSALVHHHEVTYALAIPPGREWHAGGPWMTRMHGVIARALAGLVNAGALTSASPAGAIRFGDVLCFQQITPGDLLSGTSKVVGSAQRKVRRSLLQHGSILLSSSEHAPALPGLEQLWGSRPDASVVCEVVTQSFAAETGWKLEAYRWTDAETQAIAAFVRDKYGTQAWNERR